MSWTTVFISGKGDFREDVLSKLEHSDLSFMPGFIENSGRSLTNDLFWVDSETSLREFKLAIGGKLIWKHRLHFFTTLEAFEASREVKSITEFSDREKRMMDEMRRAS